MPENWKKDNLIPTLRIAILAWQGLDRIVDYFCRILDLPMERRVSYLFDKFHFGNPIAKSPFDSGTYSRLRRIAQALMSREATGHTLQPTALVNEFFLRVRSVSWPVDAEEDLFRLAARVMKQVLVDHARKRRAQKRIAPRDLTELLQSSFGRNGASDMQLAVRVALDKLRLRDALAAKTIWQRCVEGLTLEETARVQGREVWRVRGDHDFALQWLARELGRNSR